MLYSLISAFFGKALDLFYRRRNLETQLPSHGPVLVVANHPNGLIDPIMLMRISPRPLRFLSKAPLFKLPIIGWLLRSVKALPVFRAIDGGTTGNSNTFSAVTAALSSGQTVCLFPEGISHDLPELQPLKTGAARMAFDAEMQPGSSLGLQIIPVGLHYRRKTRFRSEAATQVGEPVLVTDELKALYAQDQRAAVRELTARIDDAIRLVTVNLDQWDDLPLLEMASQIWTDENDVLVRLSGMADAQRSFLERRPEQITQLRERILEFGQRLTMLGIDLKDLDLKFRPQSVLTFGLRNILAMVVGLPLTLLGCLIYGLPYLLVRWVGARPQIEVDVVATVKLLTGMLVYLTWQLLIIAACAAYLGAVTGLLLGLFMPMLGLYSLHFLERRHEAFRQAIYGLTLLSRPRLHRRLRRERDAIRSDLDALAKVYQTNSEEPEGQSP